MRQIYFLKMTTTIFTILHTTLQCDLNTLIKKWSLYPFPLYLCSLWLAYNQKDQQNECCVKHLAVLRLGWKRQWNILLDLWNTPIVALNCYISILNDLKLQSSKEAHSNSDRDIVERNPETTWSKIKTVSASVLTPAVFGSYGAHTPERRAYPVLASYQAIWKKREARELKWIQETIMVIMINHII